MDPAFDDAVTHAMQLWGKLDPETSEWHPLLFHMLDVATVAEAIMPRFLPAGLDENGLDVAERNQVLLYFVALHDLGKATPCFQAKSHAQRRRLEEIGFQFGQFVDVPHGTLGTRALRDLLSSSDAGIGLSARVANRVAKAVGGHHGTFATAIELQNLHPERALGNEQWDQARHTIARILQNLLEVPAIPEGFFEDADGAFFAILAGWTAIADWIGSDRRFFPYTADSVESHDYLSGLNSKVTNVLGHLRWPSPATTGSTRSFAATFGFEPRPIQQEIQTLNPSGPIVILIEAAMGEGKTEAALRVAQELVGSGKAAGLYFALPTQASSNQMFGRVRSFLERAWPGENKQFHLLHSGASSHEEYQKLIASSVADDDPEMAGSVIASTWFLARKRGLLAPFAVGTVDQAMLAALQTRHWFVRLAGLSRRVVIIDEVHAYDTYMSRILDRLLDWLKVMECSVVLLSATLPERRRRELLSIYGFDEQAASCDGYPRITVAGETPKTIAVESSRHTVVRIQNQPEPVLKRDLLDRIASGGVAVWICNTVGSAQETYTGLKEPCSERGIKIDLLHARYPFEERRAREDRNVRRLSKDAPERPERFLLVTTQIVEQSLDLDFDLMVSEWAPIDLVLQRSGRLHRHADRERPAHLASPELWLMQPAGVDVPDFGASEFVYSRAILLRTYSCLADRNELRIPDDIPDLIETVYSGIELDLPSEAWRVALEEAQGQLDLHFQEQKRKAREVMVASPATDDAPFTENRSLEDDAPMIHEALQARTRDMKLTVSVVCLHETPRGLATDPDGAEVLDPEAVDDRETVARLRDRSVSLADKRIIHALLDDAYRETPSAWRRCHELCHAVLLRLRRGEFDAGRWRFILDPELGGVIKSSESGD